jgi:hypothetical protein
MNHTLFSKQDIYNFLITSNFPNSANDWKNDKGIEGTIYSLEASNWFQTYFPSFRASHLFRELESEKTQWITF